MVWKRIPWTAYHVPCIFTSLARCHRMGPQPLPGTGMYEHKVIWMSCTYSCISNLLRTRLQPWLLVDKGRFHCCADNEISGLLYSQSYEGSNISRRRNINWGVISGLPAIEQRFVIRFSAINVEWTVFVFLIRPLVDNASERVYFSPMLQLVTCNFATLLSFNHSIGRTKSYRLSIFCWIM